MQMAKPVTNEWMWRIYGATEGLGLHGEQNPITSKDFQNVTEFLSVVMDLLRSKPAHLTPDEYIPSILEEARLMMSEVMIRSRRLEAVQAIVPTERWKEAPALPAKQQLVTMGDAAGSE